ncbi:hypothetical protein E1293_45615 [Actinomadura darangshiensis]|uniref:Uncharacterized protein n=1 Tax=Actinomadura darangshiensis TaxID=705336 RepID=A0A4R4ZRB3_9ACTN|nr:hypothetical protein [Actinomadura darangshiensis]TDD60614.1 hypothetical protein E1293_45615 [Actinomadura darangshiensis]
MAEWVDWCSTLALEINQELDSMASEGESAESAFYPAGDLPELTPMERLELRDQLQTLVLLENRSETHDDIHALARQSAARMENALRRGA